MGKPKELTPEQIDKMKADLYQHLYHEAYMRNSSIIYVPMQEMMWCTGKREKRTLQILAALEKDGLIKRSSRLIYLPKYVEELA